LSTKKKDGLTPEYLSECSKQEKAPPVVELCELEGKTYVAIAEDAVKTAAETVPGLMEVSGETMGKDLPEVVSMVKSACPAVRDIRAQVIAKIREMYSVDDEIYLLRTAPSAEAAEWNDFVEECRQWGREQRALIGL